MQIKSLGAHITEVYTPRFVILFSYETPVAAYHNGQYYKTTKKHSSTTTRHINNWLKRSAIVQINGVEEKPQEWFDNLHGQDYIYRGALK